MSKLLTLVVAGVLMIFSGAPASAKRANSPNLAEVAVELNTTGPFAGQFSTLIALVVSDAEILKILTSPGQHTVFAPTNAAFDGLFAAAGANCVTLTPELVNSVVKYHLTSGRRDSTAVVRTPRIRTLLGAFLAQSGALITDGAGEVAGFVATDIPATNGMIHAVDKVLLPFPLPNQCGV
jgi:uncharacterized surface protein with fasciclin (FAS1) repeats